MHKITFFFFFLNVTRRKILKIQILYSTIRTGGGGVGRKGEKSKKERQKKKKTFVLESKRLSILQIMKNKKFL